MRLPGARELQRWSSEIVELASTCAGEAALRATALDRLRTLLPFDSAMFIAGDIRLRPVSLNKEAFVDRYRYFAENPDYYRRGIQKGTQAAEAHGAYLDLDVFDASERRNLPLYAEMIRPQRINSQVITHLKFRGRPLGIVHLCRHGVTGRYRSGDAEVMGALVPLLSLAMASIEPAPVITAGRLAQLSPREQQVAQLVCRGLTNREVARLLGTSAHTVRNQLHSLFERLGLSNRAELASWVLGRDV